MGFIDIARDTLRELPMSDIVRERLSLALDRLAESESKVEVLQSEKANFQAQLEIERLNHSKTQQELQRLKDEHAEEIRVHSGVEFRRGKRTGGVWSPFCPVCHAPGDMSTGLLRCAHPKCGWSVLLGKQVADIISKL